MSQPEHPIPTEEVAVHFVHPHVIIETPKRSLSVALQPDRRPADSLLISAAENRTKAARLLRQAALMELAAKKLDPDAHLLAEPETDGNQPAIPSPS